ncbi:MAG: hypothetical protein JNL02_07005 [Saprospiraceae bacterium]|nr:hypothetical protein [Saprospiraceae bacterium]
MATFYYNTNSSESYFSQWERYIQNQAYFDDLRKSVGQQTKDFSSIVSRQTQEIDDMIKSASREQSAVIQQSTNAICGTLENGFGLLSDNLQEISYGIDGLNSELNEMASMLDWKLSLVIEQQRITNLLMGNIAFLLRIPDIQKERQYHIEQGIKFLKNAIFDNDFYNDSLTNLLKAEKIESTDFFALHRIGLIYMYSPKHLALEKAEDYFKKAAKYAVAESNVGASVTTNYLTGDIDRNLLAQSPTPDSIKIQAAEAYLFAGRSCYIQGKFSEAADLAGKGFSLVPQMIEAGFTQAKALAANNNESQAAIVLERVINTDRYYSLKTLSDLDLCPKSSIQNLLTKLQTESTDEARQLFLKCKQQQISGSNASDYLDKIESLINKNSYLTSKKAIDLIEKVRNWNYCEPQKNPNQTKYFNKIVEMIGIVNSLQYHKSGGTMIQGNPSFSFTSKITNETQWNFANNATAINVKTHGGNFKVYDFLANEKRFNDTLPKVVADLKTVVQQYMDENQHHLEYLENERRRADNANYAASVGEGIGGGLLGAGGGFVVGFILGFIVQIGYCVSNPKDYETIVPAIVLFSATIIGGLFGAIGSFNSRRKR